MFSSPLIPALSLLIFLPLLFLIAPRILLLTDFQISLSPDELDDVALFHKAILASSSHHHRTSSSSISHLGTTTNPKPKVAFLFLTNSDLSFAPLWEKFFHGHQHLFNIYIHADPTVQITPPGGVFEGRFVRAKKTERGSPTLVSAARRLLANAILDDPLNLYFALVSQHCIPLHSFPFVYKTLFGSQLAALRDFATQSNHQSFIEILSDDPNLPERYVARGTM
ncbi:uncharacterized protein Pyn_28275 [Prunus yedoensis var. nudiflora]|uniref:Glycosyltransferase n=1 Tax=Prunus yedoensis var. nudiflora TaxID=2094558 RepID=A0A314ZH49_PRUYE|nr:uncharacterized protein Pyn_28275 [Prunus yedoensis var. nudiflora]